jgi:AcrR family transcriptional regulator
MKAALSPTVHPRPDVAPKRGRPRNAETHRSILRATIVLIREIGYDAVTMEGVAEKAGVGKATLYRRWDGKEMLVAEAIKQIANEIPITDTGTLRGDLLTVLRTTAGMYRDPATGALLSGLVAAIARSERIAAAVRGGFVAARREALRQVLERWRERGELFPDVDVEILMDMINGPLFYRFLLRGETVSEPVVEAIVDMLLGGIRAPDPYRST